MKREETEKTANSIFTSLALRKVVATLLKSVLLTFSLMF